MFYQGEAGDPTSASVSAQSVGTPGRQQLRFECGSSYTELCIVTREECEELNHTHQWAYLTTACVKKRYCRINAALHNITQGEYLEKHRATHRLNISPKCSICL